MYTAFGVCQGLVPLRALALSVLYLRYTFTRGYT